jgi:hypothetical protein
VVEIGILGARTVARLGRADGAEERAMDAASEVKRKLDAKYAACSPEEQAVLRALMALASAQATPEVEGFVRTAPVPNIPPLPGMNPGAFALAHGLHESWSLA